MTLIIFNLRKTLIKGQNITGNDIKILIDKIKTLGEYDYIIVDLDSIFSYQGYQFIRIWIINTCVINDNNINKSKLELFKLLNGEKNNSFLNRCTFVLNKYKAMNKENNDEPEIKKLICVSYDEEIENNVLGCYNKKDNKINKGISRIIDSIK